MKRKIILSMSFIGLLITSMAFDYDKNINTNKLKSSKEIVVGYHGKQYIDDAVYKINKSKENDFLFGLGNSNTMMYVTDISNYKVDMIKIDFYIENNTDKEILATTNLICKKDYEDKMGTIVKSDSNNSFKIYNNQTMMQTVVFKIPNNMDLEDIRINILSETIDGNPLTDVTGKLNFIEI